MKEVYSIFEAFIEKISDEITDWIWSRKNLFAIIWKAIIAISIATTASFPVATFGFIFFLLSWNNWIISTLSLSGFIVFYLYPKAIGKTSEKDPETIKEFFGHPIDKILDHLFQKGNFRREDAERIGISRQEHSDMIKEMEEKGILIRGANNARVLDIRITREQAEALLSPIEKNESVTNCNQLEKMNTEATQTIEQTDGEE